MNDQIPSSNYNDYSRAHLGLSTDDIQAICSFLKISSPQELLAQAIPKSIYKNDIYFMKNYSHATGLNETKALELLSSYFSQDKIWRQWIGQGYYQTITPSVIKRYFFENPGWYTPYTPYQSEISQGRLELLFYFQTLCCELTGFDLANASLLDEGSAACEAMRMSYALAKNQDIKDYFVSDSVHRQTLATLSTRAKGMGITLWIGSYRQYCKNPIPVFGAMVGYPDCFGEVNDFSDLSRLLSQHKAMLTCVTDLLALTIVKPPKQLGADIAVGNAQRLGVPMGYGGPHGAFFATSKQYRRHVPARIVGRAKDRLGNNTYRLALQTREQHIRRHRATSNICTSQALLANMAACYAIFHGKSSLIAMAKDIHRKTSICARLLIELGYVLKTSTFGNNSNYQFTGSFFDTVTIDLNLSIQNLKLQCDGLELRSQIIFRTNKLLINLNWQDPGFVSFSFGEGVSDQDIIDLIYCISNKNITLNDLQKTQKTNNTGFLADSLKRDDEFLNQQIFNQNKNELSFMRFLKRLENKDLSLVHSMIPLGSCTMKLNSAISLQPLSWRQIQHSHPHQPFEQVKGYHKMLDELAQMLGDILGLEYVSLQPNSGAQGELAGLWAIRHYFQDHGLYHQRSICLVPHSAHGTNPASAVMAGLTIKVIKCDAMGNIDLIDLAEIIDQYRDQIACLMLTYPSTHGVYEPEIVKICEMVHQAKGFVYLDGANLNAQVAAASPFEYGVDVCHVNLHKTFCIPHGGGGPGAGPIAANKKLAKYLPANPQDMDSVKVSLNYLDQTVNQIKNSKLGHLQKFEISDKYYISSAHYGSASILTISWMFLKLIGAKGLRSCTELAVLSANYIAEKLSSSYPILYRGLNNRVAHECLIDLRPITKATKITVEDIAKRLMDYGFHAPTISFPIAQTMMIEPTECESLEELDRFVEAMITIRAEIDDIAKGVYDISNNPLKNAPHTWEELVDWKYPYCAKKAVCPLPWIRQKKFWPSCGRIDNAQSDRNFVCACDPIENYQ